MVKKKEDEKEEKEEEKETEKEKGKEIVNWGKDPPCS